jgi:hypothetical protein
MAEATKVSGRSSDAEGGEGLIQIAVVFSPRTRRTIRLVLGAAIVSLVVLGTIGEVARLGFGRDTLFGFTRLFCLGEEANVPTWYSSATLLMAAVLAGTAAMLKHQLRDPLARQWTCLSVLLGLMSLDETAAIHETFPALAAYRLLGDSESWLVYYAWILPGAALLASILWWFAPLWRGLGAKVRRQFTAAAAIYFGGALGVEVAEAACAAALGLKRAKTSPIYSALWNTQELLEMLGVAAFILAMIDHLALERVCFTQRSTAARDANGVRALAG